MVAILSVPSKYQMQMSERIQPSEYEYTIFEPPLHSKCPETRWVLFFDVLNAAKNPDKNSTLTLPEFDSDNWNLVYQKVYI